MLFKFENIVNLFQSKPDFVIHIGAHLAEEEDQYVQNGIKKIIWIEAQSELVARLKTKFNSENHIVIHAAVWSKNDQLLNLNISNNSQSSSLLKFGKHREIYPLVKNIGFELIKTKRVDSLEICFKKGTFVNLDIQGAELEALKGFGSKIQYVDYIYLEVNRTYVYEDCTLISDVDNFLHSHGFRRVATKWVLASGWGDAFYVREGISLDKLQNLLLKLDILVWYLSESIKLPFRLAKRKIGKRSSG